MQDIQRYCNAIAAAFKPRRIILFGSHAYGVPHVESDVDILVAMPTARRWKQRLSLAIREQISADFPVDIIVHDPAFVAGRLLAWIEADWLLPRLFGEVHAPERVMAELRAEGAPDRVRQWAMNPPG